MKTETNINSFYNFVITSPEITRLATGTFSKKSRTVDF